MKAFQRSSAVFMLNFALASLTRGLWAQNFPNRDPRYPGSDFPYGHLSDIRDGLAPLPGFGRGLTMPCPAGCICSESTCGKEVDCSGLSLTEVPKDLSPETECLDLSMNNITKITTESFAGLRQLKKLCLSGNFLTELPPEVFTGFRRMHTLMLQDNLIESIPANTISKMTNLKDLHLAANYISEIAPNAFVRLDSLQHIWLDDNSLQDIPAQALSKVPTVKALNLNMNDITTIRSGDLKQLSMLNVLLLKHNKISTIESNAFEGATNIQIVHLSNNNLTSFPLPIKNIFNLRQLTLGYNKIETLPVLAFAGNPKLRILSIEGNPLRQVGRTSFTGLKYLKTLSVEDANEQEEFPDLSGCLALDELTITGGKIAEIPANLCTQLPSLRKLTLSRNRLQNLSGLRSCGNLTKLDASGNQLTKLTFNETESWAKLEKLDLDNNDIHQIDEDAFSTMKLDEINLAYNSFTFMPIKGIRNLRTMNIRGVRTMLYLPPIELFKELQTLVAFYPYHCCQFAEKFRDMPSGNQWDSRVDQFSQSGIHESPLSPQAKPVFPTPSHPPLQCSPDPGPLTPCKDLLPTTSLRIFSWVLMIAAFLLNGLILLSCGLRYCVKRRSRSGVTADPEVLSRQDTESPYPGNAEARMMVYADSTVNESRYCLNLSRGSSNMSSDNDNFDLALCHLAFADFIVVAYTAVILSYDHSTRGIFAEQGAWWQQSAPCHSAGFLLTFGTQLAFITVAVMAIERYLATMHPLQPERHMRKVVLIMALTAAWVFSSTTAVVTLFGGGIESTPGEMLPAQNGAACLPWTTRFAYVASFVGLHVLVCIMAVLLCLTMFCARRKQSWLSARKSSRRQVALAVAINVALILPLALIALYVSVVMNYSEVVSGNEGEYYSGVGSTTNNDYGRMVLDTGRVLEFVMYAIPLRPLLNPVLYIFFNKALRRDLAYLGRKIFLGDAKPRHIQFPQQQDSVADTLYESSVDVPREAANDFPLFNQQVFDSTLLQQRTSYDNGGIVNSSSVSYHSAASAPFHKTSRQHVSSLRSSGRRRRRRHSRSRRNERRTPPDTDPTTESEVITFHRGDGSVRYNPEARERRRKKLSVRYGGVNARDEFQRLVFPRVANSSSTSHGSDSTIYPIMPASRAGMPVVAQVRRSATVANTQPSTFPAAPLASYDETSHPCSPVADNCIQQRSHYDLSALNTFRDRDSSSIPATTSTPEINNNKLEESSGTTPCLPCDTDKEVADITASICQSGSEHGEPAFFSEKDTIKRSPHESVRRKTHHRSRSRDEEFRFLAVRNAAREDERKEAEFPRYVPKPLAMTRKDSAASHSSSSDIHPAAKLSNSCDYCDSSASKDSGIHSEIDSASGASYSDASIGRRLRFTTSGGGINNTKVSSGFVGQREIDRFELPSKIQEFQIVPTRAHDPQDPSEVLNPETTI